MNKNKYRHKEVQILGCITRAHKDTYLLIAYCCPKRLSTLKQLGCLKNFKIIKKLCLLNQSLFISLNSIYAQFTQ